MFTKGINNVKVTYVRIVQIFGLGLGQPVESWHDILYHDGQFKPWLSEKKGDPLIIITNAQLYFILLKELEIYEYELLSNKLQGFMQEK